LFGGKAGWLIIEHLTFALAFVGYVGLTIAAVRAARDRPLDRRWTATVVVITLHVILVWAVRYGWRLAEAVRNGYAGFLLFHAALAMILSSLLVRTTVARMFVITAFGIVTVGAVGATLRYAIVAPYVLPVAVTAAYGVLALVGAHWRRAGTAGE
jgi:hypothetical protein